MTHKVALCAIPLLHCHTDSFAVPGDRATARGAAIVAPACRHPSRQRRRSAVLKSWSGRLYPKLPPPIPPMLVPPSVPKGGTALARSPAARSCPPKTDGTFHFCARRLAPHVLPKTFVLRAGALPRLSRFALGYARPRSLCPHAGRAPTLRFCPALTLRTHNLPPRSPSAGGAATSLLCLHSSAPCSAGLADSASSLLRRSCARRTAASVLKHRTGFHDGEMIGSRVGHPLRQIHRRSELASSEKLDNLPTQA